MALQFSTGLKDAVLDTGSVKSTFDGGFIKIYTGTPPATADAALAGNTELVKYSDSGGAGGLNLDTAAVDGALPKAPAQTWQGTAGNTGTASFFRYWQTGDADGLSTTAVRMQGTVGGAGADLYVASTSFADTTVYTLDLFSIAIPDA
jgi:hypothetical protein